MTLNDKKLIFSTKLKYLMWLCKRYYLENKKISQTKKKYLQKKIYKEPFKPNSEKKMNNPVKKLAKNLKRHFTKMSRWLISL